MDLSSPTPTTNSPLIPVFGDNVQDLLSTGALNVNPTGIIVVNSIADTVDDNDGVTTLREAINQANADDGEDLIVFERSLFSNPQTITLGGTELDITHNLDIIAPRDPLTGGDLVTVSGNNSSRVFEIEKGATVTLSGLIVADGSVTGESGGGIINSGTLTLDSSIVRNNSTHPPDNSFLSFTSGGGIFSSGNLTVNNSTISGNSPPLALFSATRFGGGIYSSGSATVNNSTISGNSAFSGGGIYSSGSGATVNNSTISGNSAANSGGGIYNYSGTIMLLFSTVTQNQAGDGSGVYNTPSSISSRPVFIGGNATNIRNSGGATNIRNTIIASNLPTANGINPDVSGTFSSNGYNLIGDSTGSTGFGATGDIVGTSDNPIDPRLAPLDFYGGSTQNFALLPDSPAIDAADPTVLDTDPTTDQRGLARVVNGRADIGAFEFS